MRCKTCDQSVQAGLLADNSDRQSKPERGFDQAVGNLFWQDIVDADHQSHGAPDRLAPQRILHLVA